MKKSNKFEIGAGEEKMAVSHGYPDILDLF